MLGWLIRPFWREPDERIGGDENPYMLRWHIIPRNRWFNAYLHVFLHSDQDRHFHTHPWMSLSFVLRGKYLEETANGSRVYSAGAVIARDASHAHRVLKIDDKPCWTIFCTGPKTQEWGFITESGFVHWEDYEKQEREER